MTENKKDTDSEKREECSKEQIAIEKRKDSHRIGVLAKQDCRYTEENGDARIKDRI